MQTSYSHRNGESDPPTIAGEFWFSGAAFQGKETIICKDRYELSFWKKELCATYDATTGWDIAVRDMVGRWWGPVVPPWDESNAKSD